jgi:hypothetical protein
MVNVRPDSNFEYPLLHSKASQRINPLPQTIKGNCYFYWFVTEFGEDQHISILTENYCQEKNPFPITPPCLRRPARRTSSLAGESGYAQAGVKLFQYPCPT